MNVKVRKSLCVIWLFTVTLLEVYFIVQSMLPLHNPPTRSFIIMFLLSLVLCIAAIFFSQLVISDAIFNRRYLLATWITSFAFYILLCLIAAWGDDTVLPNAPQTTPFATIKELIEAEKDGLINTEILHNYLILSFLRYTPFAAYLYTFSRETQKWYVFFSTMAICCLAAEVSTQFVVHAGFDIDQILLGFLGAIFTYVVFKLVNRALCSLGFPLFNFRIH